MSLCNRCRSGLIYQRANHTIVHICQVNGDYHRVPGDIVECTDFDDKILTSKWDMEKIAWMLKTDKSGKIQGFTPPKKEQD